MRNLVVVGILFLLCPTAKLHAETRENISLTAENLNFKYQNFEGDLSVNCQHLLENEFSQDWKVVCESKNFKREYSVHLWITRYTRQQAPRTSIETLYWVTETYPKTKGYSSTNWIHLNELTPFAGASLSVGVDDESAGLYLEVAP